MSMSSYVVGFKAPDEKWLQMKSVYDACKDADVDVPDKVMNYFNWEEPGSAGVPVELGKHKCVSKYSADMMDGFEVDLKKLPKDITSIRFFNSY